MTKKDDLYTGAVDSIPDFFVKFALSEIQKYTLDPTVEPQFRNINIPAKNINAVHKKLTELANAKIKDEMLYVKMHYDLVLSLRNTSKIMKDAIVELGPFGKDNYSPNFATFGAKMIVEEYFGEYEQHAQLRLINQHSTPNKVNAYNMRRRIQNLQEMGCQVDALFKLIDDRDDKKHAALTLVAIRPAEKETRNHDKEDVNPAYKYWGRNPAFRFPPNGNES